MNSVKFRSQPICCRNLRNRCWPVKMPAGDSLPTLAYYNNYQGTEGLDSAVELAALKIGFILVIFVDRR